MMRKIYLQKKKNESEFKLIRIDDEADETEEKKDYMLVYVPTSIILISKFSYLQVLKDCVSR
jgi:hypothetical protein